MTLRPLSDGRTIWRIKILLAAISAIRLLPHILVLILSYQRNILYADLDRWIDAYFDAKRVTLTTCLALFVYIITFYPEYRNVFYFRHRYLSHLLGLLCRRLPSLTINAEKCGPGLFIHHGFGTGISAKSIGKNCTVAQLVTVGYVNNSLDRPTIGDHVKIAVGARILRAVTLGDNSTVGANSVVIEDIPSGATVLGVPAEIIFRKSN